MDDIRDDGFVRHAPQAFASVEAFFAAVRRAAEELRLDRQHGHHVRGRWHSPRSWLVSPTPAASRCFLRRVFQPDQYA
jgi:hypothetical protein